MEFIEVDVTRCKGDGLCVTVCPSGCLEADERGGPVAADPAVCNACGHCVSVCPHDALRHSRIAAEDVGENLRSWPQAAVVDGMLRGRRSIRAYKDTPVPRALLAELVDVARFAPTASNVQEVGWIVTDDPAKVRELAILACARDMGAAYEWVKHLGPARQAGLPEQVIEDLRAGREPAGLDAAQRAVLEGARYALARRSIPAPVQAELEAAYGIPGVVELVVLCGFYAMIAGVIFAFDVPLPEGEEPPFGQDSPQP